MSGHSPFAIRPRVALGLIALTALLVRLLHLFSYDAIPISDMAAFVSIANKQLTLANLFRPEGLSYYPPGYPLFLKMFFLLFGVDGGLRAAQIAQALLGAWTCVLIYGLARRLHSRRAGLAASLMTCFYPHFVFYTSFWMSENLFIPVYYATLLLFLRAADRPGTWPSLRAGLAAGLAVLIRPAAATLAPAALFAAWRASTDWRGRTRALILTVAGGMALVVPWAARNYIASGHLVIIAPYGPFQLLIGNNPDASGGHADLPAVPGSDVWTQTANARAEALKFITSDPWGALYITLRLKWQTFWEMVIPWPLSTYNPMLFYGEHFFPYVSWRIVLFTGLMGILAARRRPDAGVVPLCLAAYVSYYMIFFGMSRYRMPAEGYFLAWAGVAAAAGAGALPLLRRARSPAWAAAVAIALAASLIESGVSAAASRAELIRPESILASGDQIPVVNREPSIPLFGEAPIPLDRRAGRYLRLSFTAYRTGPTRLSPSNGMVKITFLNRAGKAIDWMDNPQYILTALPDNRWVAVAFKAHIPPSAISCSVAMLPDRDSPDTLILDQPVLRYARGNDLAFEFIFPYLRFRE